MLGIYSEDQFEHPTIYPYTHLPTRLARCCRALARPQGEKGGLLRIGLYLSVGADNVTKHVGGCAALGRHKKVPITHLLDILPINLELSLKTPDYFFRFCTKILIIFNLWLPLARDWMLQYMLNEQNNNRMSF